MPLSLRTDLGPITTLDDWAAAIPPKQWKDGRSARELARAWWSADHAPSVPAEFAALLESGGFVGLTIDTVHVHPAIRLDDTIWHADLAIHAHGAMVRSPSWSRPWPMSASATDSATC